MTVCKYPTDDRRSQITRNGNSFMNTSISLITSPVFLPSQLDSSLLFGHSVIHFSHQHSRSIFHRFHPHPFHLQSYLKTPWHLCFVVLSLCNIFNHQNEELCSSNFSILDNIFLELMFLSKVNICSCLCIVHSFYDIQIIETIFE